MADDQQPQLPLDLPERAKRGRRRRPRPPAPRSRRSEKTLTLLQIPVLERCAMCGNRQTVFGEAALCDRCGAMIFRRDDEDQ